MNFGVELICLNSHLGKESQAYLTAMKENACYLTQSSRHHMPVGSEFECVLVAAIKSFSTYSDLEVIYHLIEFLVSHIRTLAADMPCIVMHPYSQGRHMNPENVRLIWQCLDQPRMITFIDQELTISEILQLGHNNFYLAGLSSLLIEDVFSCYEHDLMTSQQDGRALGEGAICLAIRQQSYTPLRLVAAKHIKSEEKFDQDVIAKVDFLSMFFKQQQLVMPDIDVIIHLGSPEYQDVWRFHQIKEHFWSQHTPQILRSHHVVGDLGIINNLFHLSMASTIAIELPVGSVILILEEFKDKLGVILLVKQEVKAC